MSDQTFSAGNVVRSKDGGADMTINTIDERGQLECVWFVGEKLHGGTFTDGQVEKLRD